MQCTNCHKEYDERLDTCPHCQTPKPVNIHYHKPAATCKNCATPLRPGDQFCPSCGFDQTKSIIKQTRSGKATRLIGPMVGLFAFLFLAVASLAIAYYFIAQANSDETIRAESIRIVNRSSHETIARLKENPDITLSESDWNSLRNLLERDDYRARMTTALKELRTGDLTIEPGEKMFRYIPTHRLGITPIPISIQADDQTYHVSFGDNPAQEVSPGIALEMELAPGLYNVMYQPAEGTLMQEEIEISHHGHRFRDGRIVLDPKVGSFLPGIQSTFLSGKIFINGQASGLQVKDVRQRPSLLGIHPPGTVFQLRITTKLGEVLTDEVTLADQPLTFKLTNGVVLANSQPSDIVFLNGENVGTYAEFAASDYIIGPLVVGQDVVRLQGEGTEETPFEKILTESQGGKEIELELTEDLKKTFINETKRFTMDNFQALKEKDFARYTNIQPDSAIALRLKDSLDIFIQSKEELDYVPFALRFSNDSFRVYAKDGRAYAEFIESYFIKYVETDFQNHSSWLKKMVFDQAQNKWLFYEDELLVDYVIPEDNSLVFFE